MIIGRVEDIGSDDQICFECSLYDFEPAGSLKMPNLLKDCLERTPTGPTGRTVGGWKGVPPVFQVISWNPCQRNPIARPLGFAKRSWRSHEFTNYTLKKTVLIWQSSLNMTLKIQEFGGWNTFPSRYVLHMCASIPTQLFRGRARTQWMGGRVLVKIVTSLISLMWVARAAETKIIGNIR